jgi:hypothetical protein
MGTDLFIVPFVKLIRLPTLVFNSGLGSGALPQQFGG